MRAEKLIKTGCLLAVIGFSIACSAGGKSGPDGAVVTLRLGAKAGDRLNAYQLGGSSTNPGSLVASAAYDAATGTAVMEIPKDRSYRIRLERGGAEFMETAILSEQFAAEAAGRLDIGEINAATTFYLQSAISQAKEKGTTAELELKARLSANGVAGMDRLRMGGLDTYFSGSDIQRFNLVMTTIARFSKALDAGSHTRDDWNLIVDLFHAMFSSLSSERKAFLDAYSAAISATAASRAPKSGRQAAADYTASSLASDFVILVNSGRRALPDITPSNVGNFYIANSGYSLESFLSIVQGESASSFLRFLALHDETMVPISSFDLAHATYGTKSGNDFTVHTLAPVFRIAADKALAGGIGDYVSISVSGASASLGASQIFDGNLVRKVTADNKTFLLMVKKSASTAISAGKELSPGASYRYTISPVSGKYLVVAGVETTAISGTIKVMDIAFTYPVSDSTSDSLVNLGVLSFTGMASTTPAFLVHSRLPIHGYNGEPASYGVLGYLTVTLNGSRRVFNTGNYVSVSSPSGTSFVLTVGSSAGLAGAASYTLGISPGGTSGRLMFKDGTEVTSSHMATSLSMDTK